LEEKIAKAAESYLNIAYGELKVRLRTRRSENEKKMEEGLNDNSSH